MIVLYSATSLDGYIARRDGSIDWLGDSAAALADYQAFRSSIDCLLMGRRTYDQVLGFGEWPYPGLPTFVFTHHAPASGPAGVTFVGGDPAEVADRVAAMGLERIWLVGGANLTEQFLVKSRIDELHVFVLPILLGDGIPLFPPGFAEKRLSLRSAETVADEMVKLSYLRSPEHV